MDNYTKDIFDKIIAKDVESLNKNEKAFIVARRSYLNKTQKEKFESILPKAKVVEKKETKTVEEKVEK